MRQEAQMQDLKLSWQ